MRQTKQAEERTERWMSRILRGISVMVCVCGFLLACGEAPPVANPCKQDSECSGGLVCSGGKCVQSSTPGKCSSDKDCEKNTATRYCESSTGQCRECVVNTHCKAGYACQNQQCVRKKECDENKDCLEPNQSQCNPKTRLCQECLEDKHCKEQGKPFCDASGSCQTCADKRHCKQGQDCLRGQCVAKTQCDEDWDCPEPGKSYCNVSSHRCVACDNNTHCKPGYECKENTCQRKTTCQTDADCVDPGASRCDTASGKCIECKQKSDCTDAAKPYCHSSNRCIACAADTDCKDTNFPKCAPEGSCVRCLQEPDCAQGYTCIGTKCERKTTCTLDRDCIDAKMKVCDKTAKQCVECLATTDCKDGYECKRNACERKTTCASDKDCIDAGLGRCDSKTQKCVACLTRLDCKLGQTCRNSACVAYCSSDLDCQDAAKPACDWVTNQCVACSASQHCATSQICDKSTQTCKTGGKCTSDNDCSSGQICDTGAGSCVECSKDEHCPLTPSGKQRQTCDSSKKQCQECTQTAHCQLNQICVKNRCVQGCSGVADCATGLQCLKATGATTGICGKCLQDSDCATGQKCNVTSFLCGTCATHDDCKGNLNASWCDPRKAECGDGCNEDIHCLNNSAGRACDRQRYTCVECLGDSHCPRGQRCDAPNQRCVECLNNDSHCTSGKICQNNGCVDGCTKDDECTAISSRLKCSSGRCRECDNTRPCATGKVCNSKGMCVVCAANSDCPTGQVCDTNLGRCFPSQNRADCAPCATDSDCSNGYRCMAQDFRSFGGNLEKVCLKSCSKDLNCTGYQASQPLPTIAPPNCVLKNYNNHAYFFCDNYKSWQDAAADCAQYGGYLATVNDKSENDWLYQQSGTSRWIGLWYENKTHSWQGESSSYTSFCSTSHYEKQGYYLSGTCWYSSSSSSVRYVCEFDGSGSIRGYRCDSNAGVCRPAWGGAVAEDASKHGSCQSMWTRGARCERTKPTLGQSPACGLNSTKSYQNSYESYCSPAHDQRCLMMCNKSNECPVGFACDTKQSTCIKSCAADKDCDGGEYCDTVAKQCVVCLLDSHCTNGKICNANQCANAECSSDKDCKGGLKCSQGRCRECSADTDCGTGRKCTYTGRCRQCLTDTDCGAGQTCHTKDGYCYATLNRTECMPCSKDTDCKTGYNCVQRTTNNNRQEQVCLPRCVSNSDCPGYDAQSSSSFGYYCDTKLGVCTPQWTGYSCDAIWNDKQFCLSSQDCASGNCDSSSVYRCYMYCSSNNNCSPGHVCIENRCQRSLCKTDKDCPGIERCDSTNQLCGECVQDAHCTDPTRPACNKSTGKCTICIDDTHCKDPLKPVCAYDRNTAKFGCRSALCLRDSDCGTTGQSCIQGRCRECHSNKACPTGKHCAPTGSCVACLKDSDCGTGKICDLTYFFCHDQANRKDCEPCTNKSDCATGYTCVQSRVSGIRRENVCLKTCTNDTDCAIGYTCYNSVCRPRWGVGSRYGDQGTCASLWTNDRSCSLDIYSNYSSSCGLGSTSSYCCSPTLYESYCGADRRCKMSCASAGDCPTGYACDTRQAVCVPTCKANSDCNGKYCDTNTGICVPCLNDSHCTDSNYPLCKNNTCVAPECSRSKPCASPFVCENHRCRECTATQKCSTGKVCTPEGICAACATDGDCKTDEICDTKVYTCFPKISRTDCMPCSSDNDCDAKGGYKCIERNEFIATGGRSEKVCIKGCSNWQQPCLDSQSKPTGYSCSYKPPVPISGFTYGCVPMWNGATIKNITYDAYGGSCASLWTRGRACFINLNPPSSSSYCGLGSTYRYYGYSDHTESYCSIREGCVIVCAGPQHNLSTTQECPVGMICRCVQTPCRCETACAACKVDSDCGSCGMKYCNSGTCSNTPACPSPCKADTDCGSCGMKHCNSGTCSNTPACPTTCRVDTDCNVCGMKHCNSGTCSNYPACTVCRVDSDCGSCGMKFCNSGTCSNTSACATCKVDGDCGLCGMKYCNSGTCSNTPACATSCKVDGDCAPCSMKYCNGGKCTNTAAGTVVFGGICDDLTQATSCASGLLCVKTSTVGYCTRDCTKDQTCPKTSDGVAGLCSLSTTTGQVCGFPCSKPGETCPKGLTCQDLGVDKWCIPPKPTGNVPYAGICDELTTATTCASGLLCLKAGSAKSGYCTRDCTADKVCPKTSDGIGGQCVQISPSNSGCVFPCGQPGQTCPKGLSCTNIGGTSFCLAP